MIPVDQIRWTLGEPEPAPSGPSTPKPAPTVTNSRASLVQWWQWRYASLNAECSRLENVAVQSLCEAQFYREIGQVALEQSHDLTQKADRQRETIGRLRRELKTVRQNTEVSV